MSNSSPDLLSSNERALTMSVMKASEHGFNDGDHLVIDGHEYSAEQVYDAIHGLTAVETTTGHCIDCIELKNALAAAVKVANEARECHDRDQDMRTMKLLIALSGHLPKWRADTDRIHDVLRRAVERLSAPMPPEEPTPKQPCDPDDHLYVAVSGSPIGEGICVKCGDKEQPEKAGEPARELSPSESASFAKTLARSPRRVEPPAPLPLGFVMVAQCASCCVQDFPSARHHSLCACNPGELVRPVKATERICAVCQTVNIHSFDGCANCGALLESL